MKKLKLFTSLIIIFAMLFSFSACKKEKEEEILAKPEIEEVEDVVTRADLIANDELTDNVIDIYLPEELAAIPDYSAKSYRLANDIDMTGRLWTVKDFRGVLDGNGFTIKNLTISGYGQSTEKTYDGNMKEYETVFCGMFAILDGAEVKNLVLDNISFKCSTAVNNIFAGSVAGFMKDALISNVKITGKGYLETSSKCFGIGGIAGYGRGLIDSCESDMVLVCIDNNVTEKDEQFMGGAYAAGRINLTNNIIKIDGYDSDHGYVHNGGLVGMYIHYDADEKGCIDYNQVSGKIKFFEDNRDRRAYCAPYVGEMMSWNLTMDGNKSDFVRDEVFEYNVNLLPE